MESRLEIERGRKGSKGLIEGAMKEFGRRISNSSDYKYKGSESATETSVRDGTNMCCDGAVVLVSFSNYTDGKERLRTLVIYLARVVFETILEEGYFR